MSGDADLLAPVTETPPPVADAAPTVTPPAVSRETPAADDEPEVLEIPTGEKLVPLSALESSRAKTQAIRAELDAAKTELGKSAERDARIQQLEQQLQSLAPKAQAYDAAIEAQSRQPQKAAEPTAEETAELQEIAKDFDFYKSDGTLDMDRAQRHQTREIARAQRIAQEQVQPFHRQTVTSQSDLMFHRAVATVSEDGMVPDPHVLKAVWEKLDPSVTSTLEGARVAYAIAKGVKSVPAPKPKAKEEIPAPLESEKAGGKDVTPVTLRDSDRQTARDMGLTDKQYQEQLAQMPAGWGKGA